MATTNQTVVGFGPDQFVQKGLPSDIDVRITKARWTEWNYGGAVSADRLAIAVYLEFKNLASDEEHEQYLSAGSLADSFRPNPKDDGKTLEVLKGEPELAKGSNWHLFMDSLWKKGWPSDPNDPRSGSGGDVSVLEGLEFHLQRVKAPERPGLKREPRKKEFEEQIMVATAIIRLPWEAGKGSSEKGATRTMSAAPAQPVNGADQGDDSLDAAAILAECVGKANGRKLSKEGAKMALLRRDPTMPAADRDAIIAQWADTEWLESVSESIGVIDAGDAWVGA